MKIAAVSLNVIVGDVDNNLALIKQAYQEACGVNDPATGGTPQDLLLLPECVTCGYPPQDLLLRPSFMMKIMADLADLTQFTKGHHTKILLGSPYLIDNKIYNAAIFIDNGVLSVVGTKKYLPDYGEFDDSRIFHQGQGGSILPIGDKNFGILICEDMWHKDTVHDLIISEQDDRTIDGFISLNASPYEAHKFQKRHAWAHAHCKDHQRPFLNIYLMGGAGWACI